ncbi:MAG: hypothetical protein JWL90_4452 [Chthoniobacteraceae bacterium]|nr:hypothetical protein [Chthoniobacteraceae bacterium]
MVLYSAVFLAFLALVCGLIGSLHPFPEVNGIAPKLRYFAAHRDDYELLFIGSSRFYRQIIPRQFDAQVENATGVKIRSFNFGWDGCYPPESYFLTRKLLALRPRNLRWVVVEMMDINPLLNEATTESLRMAYWHDWRHTLLVWRRLDALEGRDPKKWKLTVDHGTVFLKQFTALGRSAELLHGQLLGKKPARDKSPAWAGAEGFTPGPDSLMAGEELRFFEQQVEQVRRNLPEAPMSPALSTALIDLIAEIRAAGAEPLFVIAPNCNPLENFRSAPGNVPLFAFNDPNLHPVLFEPAMHYNGAHLNEKGAAIFTRLLAERFGGIVQNPNALPH